MSITLLQVIAAARSGQVSLVGEMVGYLVLGVADQVVGLPRRVNVGGVELGAEGALRVAASEPVAGADCEADLRQLLSSLLDCSRTATPALAKCGRRVARGDIECFVRELEAALIPVNRSAGRRVLARLFRETQRAVDLGSLVLIDPPDPVMEVAGIPEERDAPSHLADPVIEVAGIPEERGAPSHLSDPVIEVGGIPEERGAPSHLSDPVVEVAGIQEQCGVPSLPLDRQLALEGPFGTSDAVVGMPANSAPVVAPADHTVALEVFSPGVSQETLILNGEDLTDRVPEAWTPTAFWMEPEAPPQERTAPLPLAAGPLAPVVEESVDDFEIEVEVDFAVEDLPELSLTTSTPWPSAPVQASRVLVTPLLPVAVREGEPGARPRVGETTPVLFTVATRSSVSESNPGVSTEPQVARKEPASPAVGRTQHSGVAMARDGWIPSESQSPEPEAAQSSSGLREPVGGHGASWDGDPEYRSGNAGDSPATASVLPPAREGTLSEFPSFARDSDSKGETAAEAGCDGQFLPLLVEAQRLPFDESTRSSEEESDAESLATAAVGDPLSGVVEMAESEPLAATSTDESFSPPAVEETSLRSVVAAESGAAPTAHGDELSSPSAAEELESRSDRQDGGEPRMAGVLSPVQGEGSSGSLAGENPTGAPEERRVDVDTARRRVEQEVVEAQLAQAELRREEIAPEPEEPVEWIPVSPPVETRTPVPVGDVIDPWDEQPVQFGEFRPAGPELPRRTPTRFGSAPPVFAPRCSDVDELLSQFGSGQSDDEIRSSLVEFAEEFSPSVPVAGVRSRCARATSGLLGAPSRRPDSPTTEQGSPRGR